MTQSRKVCRSMAQSLAASPRAYPSSTNASPNIRRAALASLLHAAACRKSVAVRSARIIVNAFGIEPSVNHDQPAENHISACLRRPAESKVSAAGIRPHLCLLRANITLIAVDETIELLHGGALLTFQGIVSALDDIDTTLRRELSSIKAFVLSSQDQDRFNPKEPLFGADVALKFPSISYKIDEAAKCLALERSTASVFHSLRSLEVAIRAIARCLGIPDPTRAIDRNWGKVLGVIKGEIDKRWPTTSGRMSGDGRYCEEAYAALAAMQNPWRNATMHWDQKYTSEEARHIFEVVGGFMRKLSSRMNEDGLPLA